MGLQERPAPPFFQWVPAISATPRSFLAAILSLACILSRGGEWPRGAAGGEGYGGWKGRPPPPFFQWVPAISATPRSFLAAILSLACILSLTVELPASAAIPAAARDKKHKTDSALKGLPITELNAVEAILHALNRLSYAPRPGDAERVLQMGLAKWIEQQLNPIFVDDRSRD